MPLPGFVRDDTITPEMAGELLERSPSAATDVRSTLLSGGTLGLPSDMVVRNVRRGVDALADQGAEILTPEAATARFGIEGELKFDKPITASAAAYRRLNKRDELLRRDLLQRNESVGGLEGFGLAVLGQSALDPLGFASNFIPVAGEGRILGQLGFSARTLAASRSAAALTSAGRGALEAGVGGAGIEAIQYGLGHGVEGRDYSLDDALTGVTGGVLFGGALGGGAGALGFRAPMARPGFDSLAARLERQESRGVQSAVSPKGAIGVMQLMPDTARAAAKRLGVPFDEARLRTDEAYNRQLGREELRHLLERYDGDELLASAAYNAGPGAVDRWIRKFGDPRAGAISHEDFAAKIPFDETRDYVAKVGADRAPLPRAAEDFPPMPRAVAMLDEGARSGALARAVDGLSDDTLTDVGELMEAELARGGGPRPGLDESPAAYGLQIRGQLGEAGVATTARGEKIAVRQAIVEAWDLIASHDTALVRRSDHPGDLAPRQDGAQWLAERVRELENREHLDDLTSGEAAEKGPPIIARDGTVEAGGAEVIALQRLADNPGRFAAYRAALEAQGHDVAGFEHPVLVRVREQPMTGAQRVRLSREIEADGPRARTASSPAPRGGLEPARAVPVQKAGDEAGAVLRGDRDADLPSSPARAPAASFEAPEVLTPEAVMAADPELAELAQSVAAAIEDLKATPGLSERQLKAATDLADRDKPKTIAEAVRAAAFCLAEGGAA
ncbi:transglycosylase SLT domain-containing protein [Caulobacter sp. BK020]|uniref:transglycosylase SLT domain-containing protein n=1 Tax=Caulobacter sp. BK020 TaxID=2512117 RepID=UPI0010E7E165|nr:transglycosylase SLT domain-containing protein [Caulobacter sp. BK020]TCS14540.1 transglycosylase-like protein with SLT domain [Caulobacter sp. BK020]